MSNETPNNSTDNERAASKRLDELAYLKSFEGCLSDGKTTPVTPPIPPAVPGEMAMKAAREIIDQFNPPSVDSNMTDHDLPWLTEIITRHFAALAERADKAERDCIDEIQNRDRAQYVADNLSSAILGEDIDWPDHGAKWEEAEYAITPASEVDQLRADLASANAALEEAAQLKKNYKFTSNSLDEATQEIMTLRAQLAEARRDGEIQNAKLSNCISTIQWANEIIKEQRATNEARTPPPAAECNDIGAL